jgi:hypothetical protein
MNSGIGLRGVNEFQMSRGMLREIQGALQEAGVHGAERFVLLTGTRAKQTEAVLRSAHVPLQRSEVHDRGLSVTVPGTELQRLNQLWATRSEQLMAQVHSHPTSPFHSAVDDRYAMVTIEGGLSIVVPLFGFCDLVDMRGCAVYRLLEGEWQWIPTREAAALIRIV